MDFKKCDRCGCFFVSEHNTCYNCQPKDSFEIYKLKKYLEETEDNISLQNLSINTGISEKNLNRFLNNWGD